jgi:GNAT superfamily N-acetyltransferase
MAIAIIDLAAQPQYWQAFTDLTACVYHNDPFYTKVAGAQLRTGIERAKFTGHQQILVALEGGHPVARLVVQAADNFIDDRSPRLGLLASFEALNNRQAVHALFDHARQWLRERGIDHLVGPMDGDTWHKYRFNVGPYVQPPFMMEPYNPAYYPELWESYGFKVLAGYYSKRVDDIESLIPRFERFYNRTLRNGFHYRSFQKDRFEEELRILYDLSCQIFADNYFYTEISFPDFCVLYSGATSIIQENLVWFSQDKQGNYCGFLFAVPDYFQALQSMAGGTSLWGKVKFVMNRHKAAAVNIKTLGTLPAYHGTGVGPALMYKGYQEALQLGYRTANLCLIHQDNVSGRLDDNKGYLSRTYHLYHLQP